LASYLQKMLLVLGLVLVGCMPAEVSEVSIIELVTNAERYDGRRVKTFGFLKKNADFRLFLYREDALNDNKNHSILIAHLPDDQLKKIELCNNQYVSLTGSISMENKHLTFGNTTQIKGQEKDVYSKLVCNYTSK